MTENSSLATLVSIYFQTREQITQLSVIIKFSTQGLSHALTAWFFFFFNCYLAAPWPTLGHYRGDSLTHPMLITAGFFLHFRPEGHREPHNEVGSLSPAKHLVGFELRTFRFLLQQLNPLGHSPLSRPFFLVLKACVCYFWSNFYFSPNDSPLRTMKNVFYFI